MRKNVICRLLFIFSVLLATALMWGLAAAQDNVQTQTPYLGVTIAPSDEGAIIRRVMPDSPGAEAGLETGDVLTAIDDQDVTADTVRDILAGYAVGDTVTLTVQRGDEQLELTATLAARPNIPGTQFHFEQRGNRPFLGVSLEDGDNGAVVREVVDGSPAAEAGIQVGDVITSINDTTVSSAREVIAAVRDLNVGDEITLDVQRGDETQTITATLTGAPMMFNMPFGNIGVIYNADDQTWTINELNEASPLYEAGLRQGDIIQQFDGQAYEPMGLIEYLVGLASDAEVTLTVDRDGSTEEMTVPAMALTEIGIFGGMPFGSGRDGQGFGFGPMMGTVRLGVEFVTLDDQTASEHNVTATEGALLTLVAEDSPAAEAGLQVNDIITAVNGDQLDTERTLRDRLFAYEPGDTITLDVLRGDETLQVDVTLGQFEMGAFGRGQGNGQFFFGQPFEVPQQPEPTSPQANV